MSAWDRGNPEREFSPEVRKAERIDSGNVCRICACPRELSQLQFAHIYTHSQHPKWERSGSDPKKWARHKYVGSLKNCLRLCQPCHQKIDSVEGLHICSVSYLESLKTDTKHCTALIKTKDQIRRCRKKCRTHRCNLHEDGGLEASLVPRRNWQRKKPVPQKKGHCTIL